MKTVLEMTSDIVSANVSNVSVPVEDLEEMIERVYRSLNRNNHEATHSSETDSKPHITKHYITCQKCGKQFKLLTNRHLALHGMNAAAYREEYGLSKRTPLSCTSLTTARRKIAKEKGLGKALTEYRKKQKEKNNG